MSSGASFGAETELPHQKVPNCSTQWTSTDWKLLALILCVACLALLPGLGAFGLIDPSDALYAEGSREMLERGDLLTPYSNYAPFFEKPILIYWLIISSYKVFGVSEWSARLPSALSAILTVVLLYPLSRFFLRRRAAFLSSMFLLSSPLFAIVGHLALTDMLLTFLLTISVLCFMRRLAGDAPHILLIGFIALALATLTKGPFAILIAAAIIGAAACQVDWLKRSAHWSSWGRYISLALLAAALVLKGPIAVGFFVLSLALYAFAIDWHHPKAWWRIWWHSFKSLHPMLGIFVIAAAAGPWFVAETMATKGEFFQEFIIRQNFGRLSGTVNHQNPYVWYYIPFALAGFFPWCVYSIYWRPYLLKLLKGRNGSESKSEKLAQYSMCWLLLVVILFTIVRTKLPTYILPAFPPLALLSGIFLDRCIAKRDPRLKWIGIALIFVSAISLIVIPIGLNKITAADGLQLTAQYFAARSLLFGGLAALMLGAVGQSILTFKGQPKRGFYSFLVGAVAFVSLTLPAVLVIQDTFADRPFRELLLSARKADSQIAIFLRDSPAANFYCQRKVALLLEPKDYTDFLLSYNSHHPQYILVTKELVPAFLTGIKEPRLIESRGHWNLFEILRKDK